MTYLCGVGGCSLVTYLCGVGGVPGWCWGCTWVVLGCTWVVLGVYLDGVGVYLGGVGGVHCDVPSRQA